MKTSFAAVESQDGKVDGLREKKLFGCKVLQTARSLTQQTQESYLIWTQKRKCYSNQVSPFTNEQKALPALCFS